MRLQSIPCGTIEPMASGKREIGDLTRAIATELRAAVARRNVSQKLVAGEAEIPSPTLGKILRGTGVIDVEQLYRICRALGIEPQDVVANAVAAIRDSDDEEVGRVVDFPGSEPRRSGVPIGAVAHRRKRSIFDEQEQQGE